MFSADAKSDCQCYVANFFIVNYFEQFTSLSHIHSEFLTGQSFT